MKKLTFLLLLAFLPLTVLAQGPLAIPDGEYFRFEITTTVGNQTFFIPINGRIGDNASFKTYNWNIDWGDGSEIENKSGIQNADSILHTYTAIGTYTITITPAGSEEAWFVAFGFSFEYYSGFTNANAKNAANSEANQNMITKIISPLTPLMTRTQKQIIGEESPPSYEWAYTFGGCQNLTMGNDFTFSEDWNDITSVGYGFAFYMFAYCSGDSFTMSPVFNLPKGITTVGDEFAVNMFLDCFGSSFTMGENFNLPQNIITVGEGFAGKMFNGCSGDAFTMNEVFNIPQGITIVKGNFALEMFYNCSGSSFVVNDVFKFPVLSKSEIVKTDVFYGTFYGINDADGNAPIQKRTAASIINGNPLPNSNSQTFKNSTAFLDLPYIHENWGGEGLTLIKAVEIIGIVAPVTGSIPVTTAPASGTGYSSSKISWTQTIESKFLGGTQYTATVTLTAKSKYSFSGLETATINEQEAEILDNTGTKLTLSYTFEATEEATVNDIAIKSQPYRLIYEHGDVLDLSGLIVTLTYNDETAKDITFENFISNNITTNFVTGTELSYNIHNGKQIKVIFSEAISANTYNLTVSEVSVPIISQTVSANSAISFNNVISLQVQNSANMQVYNLKGKLEKDLNFNKGVHIVKLWDLPKGIYIVKIIFGKEKRIMHFTVRQSLTNS